MRRYRDFLANEYLGRARIKIGVSENPHGSDCYKGSIRAATGLTMSPDSIQRVGELTIMVLEAEMRLIAIRSFQTSDVSRLLEHLRSDTSYTFHTREEMLSYVAYVHEKTRTTLAAVAADEATLAGNGRTSADWLVGGFGHAMAHFGNLQTFLWQHRR